MRNLTKRELSILLITAGLIVVFATGQFFIKPMLEGQSDADENLRVKQAQILKLKKALATSQQADVRLKSLTSHIGEASADGAEASGMLSIIETAAGQAKIHIMNTQPQSVRSQKGIKFYPVELQISGQWPAIVQFLHVLQTGSNNFFIDELSLEKNADVGNSISGRILVSKARLVKL